MADVRFEVRHELRASPAEAWAALVDWEHHGRWIPATRVELGDGDPATAGSTFTAWTGFGRLALEDRMRVTECSWDEHAETGSCVVEKLGPVLQGRAGFTVAPAAGGASVNWFEDVSVKWLPQLVSRPVGQAGAAVFRVGMRRLQRVLDRRRTG